MIVAPATFARMTFDIGSFFSEPMHELCRERSPIRDIWIPESEALEHASGVGDLFLRRSSEYHQRYSNSPYFQALLAPSLKGLDLPDHPVVLDIGSGSGNTVFGCLALLPHAQVVATDISPNQLVLLRDELNRDVERRDRVHLVKVSAMRARFRPSVFDLAVGGAILHHLSDPVAALERVERALKPGGIAVFFEPFENGNAILRIAYHDILERARWKPSRVTHRHGFAVISALARDLEVRSRVDKSSPVFESLDDKWLFTRFTLEDFARRAGFVGVEIEPIHEVDAPFSNQTRVNLQLSAGLEPSSLPGWCWERLSFYDEVFSGALKRDLLIEGRITFRKG